MTEIGRALRERAEMLETSQRAHEFTWTEILAGELRLSQEMRDSVKTGTIPVSQGYIFAANLENPGRMTVFESVLANPVTNKRLTELLKKAAQGDAEPTEEAPAPFKSLYGTIQTTPASKG